MEAGQPTAVLFLVRTLDTGGLERDVAKLAVGLDRRRFIPHVAAFKGGGVRWSELEAAGVPLVDLDITSFKSPRVLQSIAKLASLVVRKRIRLIHAYDASVVFAVPFAQLLRVPVVLSATVGSRFLLDEPYRTDVAKTDSRVDGIVVNCLEMKRHLVEDFAVPAAKIFLCYNGVDTAEFHPAPTSSHLGSHPVIGSVCVLRPEKRMGMLIEAVASLASPVKLRIVGSGPELPLLQAKAAELGVADRTEFIPATSNVASHLRCMDIFISCSSSEAFSNAILEAMACGCCPVGSRVGGTPELIADGERGLLFDSASTAELTSKLQFLIDNPEVRRAYAQSAAQYAASCLSIQKAINRMSEIYDERLAFKGVSH